MGNYKIYTYFDSYGCKLPKTNTDYFQGTRRKIRLSDYKIMANSKYFAGSCLFILNLTELIYADFRSHVTPLDYNK